MKKAAKYLSAVFIPLLVPLYLFLTVFCWFSGLTTFTSFPEKAYVTLGLFAATCLPPFVLVYILYRVKYISSLTLENRADRFIPQLFGLFDYLLISLLLIRYLGPSNILSICMTATTVTLFCIALITHFWKISTHAAGIWGMLAIVSILCFQHSFDGRIVLWIMLALIAIMVSLARLYLKVHTAAQVAAGALLGISCACITFYYLSAK